MQLTHAKPGWVSPREETALHCMGLDIMHTMLECMCLWTKKVGRSSTGKGMDPKEFMERKAKKALLEHGCRLFNDNPAEGLDRLIKAAPPADSIPER